MGSAGMGSAGMGESSNEYSVTSPPVPGQAMLIAKVHGDSFDTSIGGIEGAEQDSATGIYYTVYGYDIPGQPGEVAFYKIGSSKQTKLEAEAEIAEIIKTQLLGKGSTWGPLTSANIRMALSLETNLYKSIIQDAGKTLSEYQSSTKVSTDANAAAKGQTAIGRLNSILSAVNSAMASCTADRSALPAGGGARRRKYLGRSHKKGRQGKKRSSRRRR